MTIYAVSTAQELMEALSGARGGDRIELAAGQYGDLSFENMTFSSDVTITSADPDNRAEINSLYFYQSNNIKLDDIWLDFHPDAETRDFSAGVRIVESDDITISNSEISGGLAVNGIPADSHESENNGYGVEGFVIGRAATVINSDNVTFDGNDIHDFKAGIVLAYADGMTITNNDIHDIRTTPVNGGAVNDLNISGNHFSNVVPWRSQGGGDHGDFVHIWTIDGQDGPNDNLIISNNFFEQGENGNGTEILGIYLDDNLKGIGHTNVVIDNNIMHNGNPQGVRLENAWDVTISNNTLLQSTGDALDAPGVVLTDGTHDVRLINNIYAGVTGTSSDDAVANNITGSNNLIVQRTDINAENYVGNLFTNALTAYGDLSDFMVIPNSIADGIGARQTHFSADSDPFVAIGALAGEGLGVKNIFFSANLLAGLESELDLDAATIKWNFGDGTTNAGQNVTHGYLRAGIYQVEAEVTLETGEVMVLGRTIEVSTAFGLFVNFDTTNTDLSDFVNPIDAIKDVAYVDTELGRSLSLQTSEAVLEYDISNELQGNPEYTFSLNFRFEAGSSDGKLVTFPGSVVLRLQDGQVRLDSATDAGESIKIDSQGANVDDGNWHQVTYVFSQETGRAELYLDGASIGSANGIAGAQAFSHYHGISLGSQFGGAFTGLVDDVVFLRTALDEKDVKASYENLVQRINMDGQDHNQIENELQNQIEEMEDKSEGLNFPTDFTETEIFFRDYSDLNQIVGSEGREILEGSNLDDELNGLGANDIISGGDGDDLIEGGAGIDYDLRGGAGSDRFFFREGFEIDVIRDFEDEVDLLVFSGNYKFEDLKITENQGTKSIKILASESEELVILKYANEAPQITEDDFLFL